MTATAVCANAVEYVAQKPRTVLILFGVSDIKPQANVFSRSGDEIFFVRFAQAGLPGLTVDGRNNDWMLGEVSRIGICGRAFILATRAPEILLRRLFHDKKVKLIYARIQGNEIDGIEDKWYG